MLVGSTQPSALMASYPEVIQRVLGYINSLDHHALPLGRHSLPGFDEDKAWFVVLEYHKEPLEVLKPEVHKYHSDLQIVLKGTEIMGWSMDTGHHIDAEPYLEQRDLQYYQSEGVALNFIHARPQQFYLFTPNIVHVTNIQNHDDTPVKKLVVKLHNDLLGIAS